MAFQTEYTIQVKGTKKAARELQQVGKSADKTSKQFSKFDKSNKTLARTAKLLTGWLAAIGGASAAIYKLGSALLSGAKDAASLETAFANINTLIDGPGGLTQSTKRAIVEQSKLYGQDAQTNAKAYYDIISAGITDQKAALDVLEAANKGAVAGLTSVSSAADILTTVMNAYGQEAYNAAEINDLLFQTVKKGKTTYGELAAALGRLTPIAANVGITFEEVSAIMATMTANGLKTSEAVSMVGQLMTRVLQAKGKEATAILEEWGVGFDQATLRAKGFTQMLRDLIVAADGDNEAIQKIVGSKESLVAVMSIAGGEMKNFNANLKAMKNAGGAADDALQDINNTIEHRLNVALQKNKDTWRAVSKETNEARIAWVNFKTEVAKSMAWLVRTIQTLNMFRLIASEIVIAMVALPGAIRSGNWDMVKESHKNISKLLTGTKTWGKTDYSDTISFEEAKKRGLFGGKKAKPKTAAEKAEREQEIRTGGKSPAGDVVSANVPQQMADTIKVADTQSNKILNKIAGELKEGAGIKKAEQQREKIITTLASIDTSEKKQIELRQKELKDQYQRHKGKDIGGGYQMRDPDNIGRPMIYRNGRLVPYDSPDLSYERTGWLGERELKKVREYEKAAANRTSGQNIKPGDGSGSDVGYGGN